MRPETGAGDSPWECRSRVPDPVRRPLRMLFAVITGLMVLFAVGGFFVPRDLKVERSVTIARPAVEIFDRLQSFRKWEGWASWFRRDPFLEKKFSGPEEGTGAMMEWSSRNDGAGRIKIVGTSLPARVNMAVDFGEHGEAVSWFELTDAGQGATRVTWVFSADFGQNAARRYFGLFFRSRVAKDLDEGLGNLKELLESPVPQ